MCFCTFEIVLFFQFQSIVTCMSNSLKSQYYKIFLWSSQRKNSEIRIFFFSHIVRRPSVDTISTYLSSQYRYGGSSRTASSYYAGGSFGGSQDLIDMYGHETDSVFTDEEDHISFQSRRYAIHEFNYVNLFRVFFFREIALIFLCSISNYLQYF